ncbi:related to hydrolase related to dienelactone hydrolase [Fusarium torulosum]|uniref:Related to hydrolase related to dienelactone hydrolase n=1 Tax=Fusarium torulosum TaxID=33205 RepID=A0AAE8LY02_9HYPO|nr:related to hydrolase related to dienelactone hydrolase [Fusarium torulosum]
MASNPPATCCTVASLHEGTPNGTIIQIKGNVNAYLAKPSSGEPKQAVLYLPDIFGIWQNSKLMADAFAAQGYLCLVLDTFNGDPVPLEMPDGFDIMKWLNEGSDGQNPHTPEAVDPIVVSGMEYLKSIGVTQIAAVGYCLGAKHLIRHYKSGIQVGFIAHPSFVESEELAAITGPLSIAAAELDDLFTVEKRHESEAILSKSKQDFQINLFSGVHHGFAVKGDLNNERQLFAKEQAFSQAVAWFVRHLNGS